MSANVVFLGPQGSGKGTVIGRIKERFGTPHISTGDMFREAIKNGTEYGLKAKAFIDDGKLVPDEVTIGLVRERLASDDCVQGFMLDGFPRNLSQAEALDGITNIAKAILLDVPEAVSLERLSGRRQCRECAGIFHLKNIPPKVEGVCDHCGGELYQRDDDKPEAIKERLAIYNSETTPILDFYKGKGVLRKIDAAGQLDVIIADTTAALEA